MPRTPLSDQVKENTADLRYCSATLALPGIDRSQVIAQADRLLDIRLDLKRHVQAELTERRAA